MFAFVPSFEIRHKVLVFESLFDVLRFSAFLKTSNKLLLIQSQSFKKNFGGRLEGRPSDQGALPDGSTSNVWKILSSWRKQVSCSFMLIVTPRGTLL